MVTGMKLLKFEVISRGLMGYVVIEDIIKYIQMLDRVHVVIEDIYIYIQMLDVVYVVMKPYLDA